MSSAAFLRHPFCDLFWIKFFVGLLRADIKRQHETETQFHTGRDGQVVGRKPRASGFHGSRGFADGELLSGQVCFFNGWHWVFGTVVCGKVVANGCQTDISSVTREEGKEHQGAIERNIFESCKVAFDRSYGSWRITISRS